MRTILFRWLPALYFALLPGVSQATTLALTPAAQACGIPAKAGAAAPAQAQQRLAQSRAVSGERDIAWVWLGSPTSRYPHAALGSRQHAASLHVLAGVASAQQQD